MLSNLLALTGLALSPQGSSAPSLHCELQFREWCLVGSSASYELSRDHANGRLLSVSTGYFRGTIEIRQKASCFILDLSKVQRSVFAPVAEGNEVIGFESTVTWDSNPDCNLQMTLPASGSLPDPVARDTLLSTIWLFEAGSNEMMTLREVPVV